MADPYFEGLSQLGREPSAQPVSKLAFDFERRKLNTVEVRLPFSVAQGSHAGLWGGAHILCLPWPGCHAQLRVLCFVVVGNQAHGHARSMCGFYHVQSSMGGPFSFVCSVLRPSAVSCAAQQQASGLKAQLGWMLCGPGLHPNLCLLCAQSLGRRCES